jgi:hypothetical protein
MKNIVFGLVVFAGFIGGMIAVGRDATFIPAFLVSLVIGGIYFIPSFIAITKEHRNEVAIVVLNAVAGWTFLGWVASLVWALVNSEKNT